MLARPTSERVFYPSNNRLVARQNAAAEKIGSEIKKFLLQPEYPCVAALSSFHRDDYMVGIYGQIGTGETSSELRKDLLAFIDQQGQSQSPYLTFWAVFDDPSLAQSLDQNFEEERFEQAMWAELSELTSLELRPHDWTPGSVSDPSDPMFRFSLEGRDFFVVGLHPHSSRHARRFGRPALVFNLGSQFDELVRRGQYDSMVALNRKRDQKFQGSANPMVVEFGDDWESIQFSGRNNSKQWQCPFKFLKKTFGSKS